MKRRIAVVTALVLALAGCSGSGSGDGSRLAVFAAASLTDAFTEIADSLRQRQPGLTIDLNFAGSPALALQLIHGARADVFASADQQWMTVARDSGLLDGDARTFANNRLVVITPASNPGRIMRLQDLGRPGVKLVVAGATVPAGRYARLAIANFARAPGFAPGYEARVLAGIVSNEETVRGVVTKVQLGEADAGVVYVSDVTAAVSDRLRRLEIPEAQNVTAIYPIAALRGAGNPSGARAFIDLVLSEVGQRVLQGNGFIPATN